MSELWHNGTVYFDRILTEEEERGICAIFTDGPFSAVREFEIERWKPYVNSEETTCISFNDYCTGRSGLDEDLERLVAYCKEHGIGIDEDSFIQFYGDDDGGYRIIDGRVEWLDRNDVGVINADTGMLLEELQRRKALPQPLETVPTEDLENELRSRRNPDKPDHVYVVSSLRKYMDDELYFGADTVFRTLEDAVRDVEDSIREVYRNFQIDEADAFKLGTSGDSQYYRLEWPGHEFAWNINRIHIQ